MAKSNLGGANRFCTRRAVESLDTGKPPRAKSDIMRYEPFYTPRSPQVPWVVNSTLAQYEFAPHTPSDILTYHSALRLPTVACMATTSQSFFTSLELLGCTLIRIPNSEFALAPFRTATPYGRVHGYHQPIALRRGSCYDSLRSHA